MSERVTNSRQPHAIGDLVEPVIRVSPAIFVREIKSMVGEENPINAVVVVVEGKPIGLARNGKQAVDLFRSQRYDIVLMDMEMPVMDGLEATRRIRDWEKERDRPQTPILALTAHVFEEHKQRFFSAGCSDFIQKPVKKRNLIETLAGFAPDSNRPAEPATLPPAMPVHTPSTGQNECVAFVDEDLVDFIDDYVRMVKDDCHKMTEAIKNRNYERIYDLAHNLKGSGAGYGLDFVTDCGADICMNVQKKNLPDIWKKTKSLYDYVKRVRIVIRNMDRTPPFDSRLASGPPNREKPPSLEY